MPGQNQKPSQGDRSGAVRGAARGEGREPRCQRSPEALWPQVCKLLQCREQGPGSRQQAAHGVLVHGGVCRARTAPLTAPPGVVTAPRGRMEAERRLFCSGKSCPKGGGKREGGERGGERGKREGGWDWDRKGEDSRELRLHSRLQSDSKQDRGALRCQRSGWTKQWAVNQISTGDPGAVLEGGPPAQTLLPSQAQGSSKHPSQRLSWWRRLSLLHSARSPRLLRSSRSTEPASGSSKPWAPSPGSTDPRGDGGPCSPAQVRGLEQPQQEAGAFPAAGQSTPVRRGPATDRRSPCTWLGISLPRCGSQMLGAAGIRQFPRAPAGSRACADGRRPRRGCGSPLHPPRPRGGEHSLFASGRAARGEAGGALRPGAELRAAPGSASCPGARLLGKRSPPGLWPPPPAVSFPLRCPQPPGRATSTRTGQQLECPAPRVLRPQPHLPLAGGSQGAGGWTKAPWGQGRLEEDQEGNATFLGRPARKAAPLQAQGAEQAGPLPPGHRAGKGQLRGSMQPLRER